MNMIGSGDINCTNNEDGHREQDSKEFDDKIVDKQKANDIQHRRDGDREIEDLRVTTGLVMRSPDGMDKILSHTTIGQPIIANRVAIKVGVNDHCQNTEYDQDSTGDGK